LSNAEYRLKPLIKREGAKKAKDARSETAFLGRTTVSCSARALRNLRLFAVNQDRQLAISTDELAIGNLALHCLHFRGVLLTYCLGIITAHGIVLASDSRTNAGSDQVNICRKMYTFVKPGERVFALCTSGNLSLSQSIVQLLRRDFDAGQGLAAAGSMYDAARVIGDTMRRVADMDRPALEKDAIGFVVNILLGGQIKGGPPELYMVYPQGNPLSASEDSPFLQIGETKYGRPILDRGIRHASTTLDEAAKYALLSLDSTMRSNATVGPPIDLLLYGRDEFQISRYKRFGADDAQLVAMQKKWQQSLRAAIQRLPNVTFNGSTKAPSAAAPSAEMMGPQS
jgi:putative proteasome-type protease